MLFWRSRPTQLEPGVSCSGQGGPSAVVSLPSVTLISVSELRILGVALVLVGDDVTAADRAEDDHGLAGARPLLQFLFGDIRCLREGQVRA